MGIGVGDPAASQKSAGAPQRLAHRVVGLEHVDAGEERHVIEEVAVLVHGVRHLDAVGLAELEILRAVARGDVHEPRALLHVDEIRRQQRHVENHSPGRGGDVDRAYRPESVAAEPFHDVVAGRCPSVGTRRRISAAATTISSPTTASPRVADLGYANPRITGPWEKRRAPGFPGMVHGVVVQITMLAPDAAVTGDDSRTRNRT